MSFSKVISKKCNAIFLCLICGVMLGCDYRLLEKRPLPSDEKLESLLKENEQDFERLITMSEENSDVVRIAYDFKWLSDNPSPAPDEGISLERWDEYRRLFDKLHLKGGLVRPLDKETIRLISDSYGLVTGGSSKGYAYSEIELEPTYKSLDVREPGAVGRSMIYKKLRGNWYLFLQTE